MPKAAQLVGRPLLRAGLWGLEKAVGRGAAWQGGGFHIREEENWARKHLLCSEARSPSPIESWSRLRVMPLLAAGEAAGDEMEGFDGHHAV